jgi:ABC-2 type transport system permease protein
MRKTLRIARRDYRATIRTKAFIIGLVAAPVFMGGSLLVFAIFKDRVDVADKRLAVVDRTGRLVATLAAAAEARNAKDVLDAKTGANVKPSYFMETVAPNDADPDAQRLELSDRIRRGELHAFVEIGAGIVHPRKDRAAARIAYYAKSPALDEMRGWVDWQINEELRRLRLADAGIDAARVEDLFDRIGSEGLGLVSADPRTGAVTKAERRDQVEAILVPLILPVLLMIMMFMGAMPQLHSVMEEKSQRIAEVMLGSVRPFQFAMGKILGGLGVSLTGAAVYIIGAIIAVTYMDLGQHIPYHLIPWFFTYLVLATFMFGALFVALGAACNDVSEAQAITFPAMLPLIVPMFVQMPVVTQPQSTFATALSFVPIFTPQIMLMRQGTPGGVPGWQPWVGLVGVILCALFFVWVGGRIFRVGILMQGTPPRLANLIRWGLRG